MTEFQLKVSELKIRYGAKKVMAEFPRKTGHLLSLIACYDFSGISQEWSIQLPDP